MPPVLSLLLSLSLLYLPRDPDLTGHGVSHALAIHRAETISDVRYDLGLDVTARDSALGRIVIRFNRTGSDDAILDFRGRRLLSLNANGRELPPGAGNGAHIVIPASMLADTNTVLASFVSDIAPSGASIIRFHDQSDSSDYLYTLLVPADANQLFPCFDQPDLKARVAFSLIAPAAWRVVANGSEQSAEVVPAGMLHRFTETRPLSTYLIAFAAGPWERASLNDNGRTIGMYVRRSRMREADTDSMLRGAARALSWMENYFQRPYPFEKFDFVLAPAFPFGGMEHPGAVFFNEDRFIFRERPTLPQRLGRTSTILHEVAHQWFGDLVTMRWFDDLWLKEGFATYIAAKALADIDSASGAWKTFYLGNKPPAYGIDETAGTTPVWQELDNLDQAKSNYGAIVYNKAPSVLKQLNYLVGEEGFRAGVQAFLNEHAYANATWQDLLGSIGRASRVDLGAFGRNFILRPGMPEVEQRVTVRNGHIARLELIQRPVRDLSGSAPWPMRMELLLQYRSGDARRISVTLSGGTTVVREAAGLEAPRFIYANGDDYGYALVRLDSASLRDLQNGGIGAVRDPFLRAMLWGTLWDEVRAARMDPAAYIRLALRELPSETDEQIVPRVLGRVRRGINAYLGAGARAQLQVEVEEFLRFGEENASSAYGIRKAYLDAYIDVSLSPPALMTVDALLDQDSAAGDVLRDPTRWEIVDHLLIVGFGRGAARLDAQAAHDRTPDGRRRTFIAGAAFPDSSVKRDYFTRYFADRSLNEDWASGSLGTFNALQQQELTLPFLTPALDSLRYIQANRRIFFLGGWLGAFLGGQTSQEALDMVRRFLDANQDLPADLRRKVLENADELERTVAIRKRWS